MSRNFTAGLCRRSDLVEGVAVRAVVVELAAGLKVLLLSAQLLLPQLVLLKPADQRLHHHHHGALQGLRHLLVPATETQSV